MSLFIDADRRDDVAARPFAFLSSGLALFDSELLSLVDVVVLIESRVIRLRVDFRIEAVPADLVAALLGWDSINLKNRPEMPPPRDF